MDGEALIGWYGKLPSLGDFAQRRLPTHFVETWDDWLARGLADWRKRDGDAWLDRYLNGPSWRFVLMPGVLGGDDAAWAGVLMPSVDRVGRYFPLTLAQQLAPPAAMATQLDALLSWLQRLDDLAVDALHDDWSVEQLEQELRRLGGLQLQLDADLRSPELALDAPTLELRVPSSLPSMFAGLARAQVQRQLHGKALWLRSDVQGELLLRMTTGLPGGGEFVDLLGDACTNIHPPPPEGLKEST